MTILLRRVALALMAAAGCGPAANTAGLVPVTGTVTLNGKPLSRAIVNFVPVGSTLGQGASGFTDADGRYVAKDIRGVGPGAFPGEYKVTVSKRLLPDGSEIPPDDPRPPIDIPANESLPPAYSNAVQTKLTATIPAGGGTADFALKK